MLETRLHPGCRQSDHDVRVWLFLGALGHTAGRRNDLRFWRFQRLAGEPTHATRLGPVERFVTSEVLYQLSYVGVRRKETTRAPESRRIRPPGSSGNPSFSARRSPVLGQDRPALVVAPPAADLQVARGEALAGKPAPRARAIEAALSGWMLASIRCRRRFAKACRRTSWIPRACSPDRRTACPPRSRGRRSGASGE